MSKFMAIMIITLIPIATFATFDDGDASYDRFKLVGTDDIKGQNEIIVIEDTETGCLYMRSTKGAYGIETNPILNSSGNPQCSNSK